MLALIPLVTERTLDTIQGHLKSRTPWYLRKSECVDPSYFSNVGGVDFSGIGSITTTVKDSRPLFCTVWIERVALVVALFTF
ncbi:hypothetical protein LR48_Vigan08g043700 [Vigna angularis]|uniref:Uncharacterized protein n=1 Tax=Phaseolus angularis TaxID=3914 RepID=A0A0L9V3G6_PHAAN|nr:hypothetical protein LR48_Vigan08g043700 [Vigna angularis]